MPMLLLILDGTTWIVHNYAPVQSTSTISPILGTSTNW